MTETVNHPAHYGGADNPHEPIKLIERWGLGFKLGNALKYLCRAGRKPGADAVEDLRKALWYLERHVSAADPPVVIRSVGDADLWEAVDAWDLPPNLEASFIALAYGNDLEAVAALRAHLAWLGAAE